MVPWLIVATGWPQLWIAASRVATPEMVRLVMIVGPTAVAAFGGATLASLCLGRRTPPRSSPS